MPPRLEVAVHVLFVGLMLWVAASYANSGLSNARDENWTGAVIDGVVWLIAVALCVWNVREATRKSK